MSRFSYSILLALVATASARASILIDDFTAGEWHSIINGVGSDLNHQTNLDINHVVYGERTTDFQVNANTFNSQMTFDLRNGHAGVSNPDMRGGVTTTLGLYYGVPRQVVVDFSMTPEFDIDFTTTNPKNREADV